MELVVVENVAGEMRLMWSWEAHSLQQSLQLISTSEHVQWLIAMVMGYIGLLSFSGLKLWVTV